MLKSFVNVKNIFERKNNKLVIKNIIDKIQSARNIYFIPKIFIKAEGSIILKNLNPRKVRENA